MQLIVNNCGNKIVLILSKMARAYSKGTSKSFITTDLRLFIGMQLLKLELQPTK